MKLDAVNRLFLVAFDHHLIFAKVRGRQQFKAFGNAFDLKPVILPDAQDVVLQGVILPDARRFGIAARDALENGIGRVNEFDKAILIF